MSYYGRTKSKSFFSLISNGSLLNPFGGWNIVRTLKRKVCGGGIFWFVAKYKYRKISIKLGLSIPINVFGPGLSLAHYGNIVINPQCRIGENCRIHNGVNIGAHHGKAPKIGNNVYIGPGAIIFGDIEIADNVSIGANATVNKSVLVTNVVVGCTPAKILKTGTVSWNGINSSKQ